MKEGGQFIALFSGREFDAPPDVDYRSFRESKTSELVEEAGAWAFNNDLDISIKHVITGMAMLIYAESESHAKRLENVEGIAGVMRDQQVYKIQGEQADICQVQPQALEQ